MLELLMAGGKAMIPIVVLSAFAFGIICERLWALRRKSVMPEGLSAEVKNWAQQRRLEPEHIEALERNSPLGGVLAAALRARHLGRDAIRERVEDTGRHIMHDLEKFLPTLGTIALVSPLAGLLGTVIGMIDMFLAILDHGIGDANHLAGGIGEALVCTAAGLVVAIPAYIFHRYFRAKVQDYGIRMEKQVIGLLDHLEAEVAVAAPAKRVVR